MHWKTTRRLKNERGCLHRHRGDRCTRARSVARQRGPGDTILNVVSYDARLGRTSVSNGRIYQNNDINNVGANQCEVPSVTFTAVGGSG
jgi:hypothetical protein